MIAVVKLINIPISSYDHDFVCVMRMTEISLSKIPVFSTVLIVIMLYFNSLDLVVLRKCNLVRFDHL